MKKSTPQYLFIASFFSSSIRMSEKKKFGDKKFKYGNFYKNKNVFNIYGIQIAKILISKKEPYYKKIPFKYLLGYNVDANVLRPLCIKRLQMIGYVRRFDTILAMIY